MFVVSLDDLFVCAFLTLLHNDWVALEDIKFLVQLEHIALQEEVFEGSDGLLSLLAIVLLCQSQ